MIPLILLSIVGGAVAVYFAYPYGFLAGLLAYSFGQIVTLGILGLLRHAVISRKQANMAAIHDALMRHQAPQNSLSASGGRTEEVHSKPLRNAARAR